MADKRGATFKGMVVGQRAWRGKTMADWCLVILGSRKAAKAKAGCRSFVFFVLSFATGARFVRRSIEAHSAWAWRQFHVD